MKPKAAPLDAAWTAREKAVFRKLATPRAIQEYLDATPYSIDHFARSPRQVMRDRRAHCFDGALFAAAALNHIGYPPLIVDMRSVNDDDHVIAVFKEHGAWGAVAKSNFVGLRFREPIYRTLRELIMSYFEAFFNLAGEKTLRSYSAPYDLRKVASWEWLTDGARLDDLSDVLDALRHFELLTKEMIRNLEPVDERTYRGQTVGLDKRGAYKV